MTSSYDEMMKAKKFLPLQMGYLTEDMVEKAKKELNETDESRPKAIAEIRKLVQREPDFTCPTDEAYLLQYLRARKFDVKKAFNLLQSLYKVKREYSECFTGIDFDKVNIIAKSGAGYFLPYRSPDGCAILVIQISKWNCSESDITIAVTMLAILLLYSAEDPATQVCGLRILLNVQGASLHQIRCITPRYIKLFSKALRNCMPIRFKGIHLFNESTIFQYLWSIFKLFLTEKINKRVHFHGDNQKQLHKFIPKEVLTDEYGGTNKNFKAGDWCSQMVEEVKPKIETILKCGFKK